VLELTYVVEPRPAYAKVTAPADPDVVTESGPCGNPVNVYTGTEIERVDTPLAIKIVKLFVVAVAPFASVTVTVNEKLPAIDGVPERTPAELSDTPVGNDPVAENELVPAPPLETIVKLVNAVL
jgi:hypothetical protein